MTAVTPVEFTRDTMDGQQGCGNRVQLEDANGNPISGSYPLSLAYVDKAVVTFSGTTAVLGDTTIHAGTAGARWVLTKVMIQNTSATASTGIVKLGADEAEAVFAQNQGDGLAVTYAMDARPKGPVGGSLALNLNAAVAWRYHIHAYQE